MVMSMGSIGVDDCSVVVVDVDDCVLVVVSVGVADDYSCSVFCGSCRCY